MVMMNAEQIREAVRYCPFNRKVTTPYCFRCPYEKFNSLCIRMLRLDIINFIDQVNEEKREK